MVCLPALQVLPGLFGRLHVLMLTLFSCNMQAVLEPVNPEVVGNAQHCIKGSVRKGVSLTDNHAAQDGKATVKPLGYAKHWHSHT